MALALESLTFSVETKELENAIQKIKELGQAASSLNKPIEQLGKQASEAGKKVEKVAQAADNLASSAEKSKASTKSLGKSTEDLGEDTDVVASKIERLTKQLSFLRNDQQLSTTGFTKSQAAMMAWADVAGATSDQIRVMAQIQDDFNKIMGEQALDKSVAGLNMMNRQLREFSIVQELAAKGVNLTSTQVKQLSRDMEVLRQQNEALGRNSEAGIDELKSNFTQAASEVNRLTAAAKLQEKEANKQNEALAQQNRLLEEQARSMDSAVEKWKAVQIAKADQETSRQLAEQNRLMQQGLAMMDSAVDKFKANQIAKEQKLLNEQLREQNRLMQQGATAMDEVAKRWKFIQSQKAEQERNAAIKEQNRLLAQGYVMMDDAVNKFKAGQIAKEQEKLNEQLREQNRLMEQGATAMDAVVNRWKVMQAQKADQEANKQLAEQNRLMQQGMVMMDSAVQKFKAGQIAKEQAELNAQLKEQNRLMQQGDVMMDAAVLQFYNQKQQALNDLVKAEQYLMAQEERLAFITQKTAEGFTVASANALYRYEQSLKKAGVTEQEFIGRSNAYATALKARQDVSDTNARRKAATEELIRIERQLEDQEKFLAFATAEFSKQQQQATAGNQNFADSLSMGSLRALFAYEQALRRAGVAEIDVASKSEVMRKQMLQMQQATESFNGSVNHLGRNVGVQFTDIFVSLYNGQPIMQVITQQGGQLADAFLLAGVSGQNMSQHLVEGFKKILESYKMLFAAFTGLVGTGFDKVIDTFAISTTYLKDSFVELMNTAKTANSMNEVLAVGFNKLTVAVTALGRATALLTGTLGLIAAVEVYKSVKAYDELTTSLIRFGGAILGGVDGARQYANELQELGWSAGKASEYITAVAKSGNLSEDQMRNLAAAAKDMDNWLNVSFEDTVKLHSEIKKAPVEAIVKLAKETGLVSSAVLDNIIKYEQAGETQKAVMAAMNEAIRVHGEQVNSAKKNYSDFAVFIIEIGESIKKAYNSIFSYIFEKTSPESALKEQVKTLEERLANPNMFDKLDIALGGENRKNLEETLKLSKQELDVLVKQREEQEKKSKAEYTRNKNAGVNADVQSKALAEINRADAKKMSQQEYINAVLKEQNRLYGENVLDAKSLSLIQQQAAKDWKKANESQAKPRTSFSTSVGNTVVETSKQFEQRLQLEQKLTQDQLATLENYYKDGLNSKGNYLAQEVNIVTASREKQLQILEQYNDAELAAFAEKEAKLRANAAIAVAKGGDAKSIDKQLQQNLADLAMQKQTFNEKITGKQELAYSAVTKILSKSLSEVSKSTQEVTNDVEKFSLELAKQQVSRQAEIQFAAETIGMSEKEIAVLKAKMQVQEQYNKLLLDASKNIAESESTFWEFVQGIDPMNSEALDKAWAMWQGIHKAKMKLTEAGIEQELAQRTAMQDAALAHDLANYKRLQDGVADAITTGLLEGGKEGKKKLRDLIVAELRKPIKLFIDAVVNVGLQSTGFGQGAAGSALGAVNLVDSVSKAYSTFTGGLTTSLASAAVGIGEAIGSSAAVEFGMGMKVAAFGGNTAGLAGAASTGASFGAAMPWVAGGLLAYNLLSGFDDSGTMHTGGAGGYSAAKGTTRQADFLPSSDWWNNSYDKTNEAIASAQNISKTIVTALDKTAVTFGKTAGYEVWTGFADDASSDPAWSRLFIKNLDNVLVNLDPQFADGQEGVKQYSKFLADNVVGILDGMNLPAWTKAITNDLSAFGDALTIDQVVQAIDTINNVNSLFKKFSEAMNLSQESLLGTISAFGSVDAATQMLSSYYEGFYSEAEKTAFSAAQLSTEFKKLNLKMPTSTEEFRKLVEAQDQTTEAGKKTFNALIALNSAFLGVVESIETVEQAYKRLTTINLSNEQIAQQRIDLEDELLEVVGDSQAIRAKEYVTIDKTNQSLWLLVKSFEDLDKLSSDLESALSNAASAAEKVKSIQDKATSNYIQAQDKVAEAQKKIKDIQNENLKQQIENAKELSAAFSDLSKSLKDFVYGEIKPSSQLFTETLKKALNGNQDAMKELPDAATAAIEQAKNTSRTLEEYERERAKILSGVLQAANVADSKSIASASTATSLEAKLTPEQTAMQQAQKELADALKEQKDALKIANAISASLVVTQEDLIAEYKAAKAEQAKADTEVLSISTQLTNLANATAALAAATGNLPAALAAISINAEANIKSAITMATASDLPTELKQIALASLNYLQSNFEVVSSNKSMPAEVKQVAMAAIASSSSNFGVIAKSTSIPAEVKQLALGTASALTSNITTVVKQAANGTIPASIAKLALGSQEGIATTITTVVKQAESGKIPASISELVLNSTKGLSTNVIANVIQSGSLDDASKATILSATDTIAKTFNVTVQNANGTTVPTVISTLALKTNEQLAKSLGVTVALAKGTTVPPVISTLAGAAIGTVSRTISTTVSQAAKTTIPQEIVTLAGTTTNTIGKTIDVTLAAAQAGKFPTWVTELALNSTNNAAKTVDVAINQAATNKDKPWITNLKLLTGDAVGKTVEIAIGGDPTLTAAQAALKITSADNLLKTVDLALSDSKLTADEKELITSLVQNVDGTINIEGGTGILSALNDISLNTEITAANTSSEEFAKVIEARKKLDAVSQKPQELITAEYEISKKWEDLWNWTKTDGVELSNGISTWEQFRDRINQGTWWERDKDFSKVYGTSFDQWYADATRLQYNANITWENWQTSITQAHNELNAAKQGFGNDSLLTSMGFSSGGYTGDGGKYQPAGIVHAGEVVFSQDDIAKLGGVGVVEGIRTGEIPMFANGGIVQPSSPTSVQVTKPDNSELVQELQNLREEVKMLRAEARATAMNTSKTARILDDVTQGGTEVKVAQTEEFIALFG